MLEHHSFANTPGANQYHGTFDGCIERQTNKGIKVGTTRPSSFLGVNALSGTPPGIV
jgi:hypothetical protein